MTRESNAQRGSMRTPRITAVPPHGLSTVDEAVAAIAAGRMVVVVDSPDRENEGDLVMAADRITPEAVNFMATEGRGLICVSMTQERLRHLQIPPMVTRVTDPLHTAFHVTVDHRTRTTTGISASDRAATIEALVDPDATADDFTRPGHVFPLGAKVGGVLTRAGHTEASIDLAVLAGCSPAGVICEIANPDGEMARMPDLLKFAAQHGLPILSIADLIEYRKANQKVVTRTGEAQLPLEEGTFTAVSYVSQGDGLEHVAMVYGDITKRSAPLVRVHSECLTGDLFGSKRCDCGPQLHLALRRIVSEGAGVLVYLRGHEGRGIGLGEKLRAYQLQERGLDTVEANVALGHPVDARDYGNGAKILEDLGIGRVRLLTNNPCKQLGLEQYGIVVAERVPIVTTPGRENARYLRTKQQKMGHRFVDELAPLDESFAVF
jgi:3,4-dihydroxy 2-butanone 4-phosphate synthase/GTP cyclohydrolase II